MPQDRQARNSGVRRVQVSADKDGQRLDNFLLRELGLPRTRIYRLIRKGEVRVNKGRAKPLTRLAEGDEVRIPPITELVNTTAAQPPEGMLAQLRQALVAESVGLKIVNKPSGWASQPGTGVRWSLVELAHAVWGKSWQPAHRLDRATSGCLAVVEGRAGMQAFTEADWTKTYRALVHGSWQGPKTQLWEDHLERGAGGRVECVPPGQGKLARLQARLRVQHAGWAEIELQLETGRMHQIRVQAASRGLPLIGDDRYGSRSSDRRLQAQGRPRLALHAWRLQGAWQGQELHATAPLPAKWSDFPPSE